MILAIFESYEKIFNSQEELDLYLYNIFIDTGQIPEHSKKEGAILLDVGGDRGSYSKILKSLGGNSINLQNVKKPKITNIF